MKKILVLFVFICLLCGCGGKSTKSELQNIIDEENYVVVDVRTAKEYEEGHIKGAINIPYDEIDSSIELNEAKTILVYCRSGRRSAIAAESLKKLGYDVYDMGAYDSVPLEKE